MKMCKILALNSKYFPRYSDFKMVAVVSSVPSPCIVVFSPSSEAYISVENASMSLTFIVYGDGLLDSRYQSLEVLSVTWTVFYRPSKLTIFHFCVILTNFQIGAE